MKTRFYCLAVAFIFVLIFASFGEAAMMTLPAEGDQGPQPAVTSPPGEGSAPAEGEQHAASPGAGQQAPSQAISSLAAGAQNAASPTTEQQAGSPQGASLAKEPSPAAPGGQDASSPGSSQEEAAPSAPNAPGAPSSAGEQSASPPATDQQATSPQTPNSSPAAGEQSASPPATDQSATSQTGTPQGDEQGISSATTGQPATSPEGAPLAKEPSPAAGGEQSATPPATDQQATSPQGAPPAVGTQGETPAAAGSQGTYSAGGAMPGASPLPGEANVAFLSLKESIEIALDKSPTVQSAQGVIKESQYRRLGAVSDFLPQVNMQYSYTRLDKPLFFSYLWTKDNYNWTTSVVQPVFTGGALTNSYLLAKLGVDMAKLDLEKTKRDLALEVKIAYYGVLTAEKNVEVAQQAVELVESQYTVAKAFFEVGITAKNDVLQVEVELAQARQNLIAAEHGLEVTRAVFNTLQRRDINEPVRLSEILEYVPLTMDMNALYEEALRERPEIKLSDLGIRSAKKEVGIAASRLFPQLSIVFNYTREGDDPSVSGSRWQHDADYWNVSGVAEWNIWDWGKAWWGVGESKARVFQAECDFQRIKDAVILEVQAAALKVTEARKNIQVAEAAVSQAEEDARINEERFRGQVGTTTEVLDALTRLTQARTNYYSALSNYNIAKARLQRTIGGM